LLCCFFSLSFVSLAIFFPVHVPLSLTKFYYFLFILFTFFFGGLIFIYLIYLLIFYFILFYFIFTFILLFLFFLFSFLCLFFFFFFLVGHAQLKSMGSRSLLSYHPPTTCLAVFGARHGTLFAMCDDKSFFHYTFTDRGPCPDQTKFYRLLKPDSSGIFRLVTTEQQQQQQQQRPAQPSESSSEEAAEPRAADSEQQEDGPPPERSNDQSDNALQPQPATAAAAAAAAASAPAPSDSRPVVQAYTPPHAGPARQLLMDDQYVLRKTITIFKKNEKK
jgi:hypothetical protein